MATNPDFTDLLLAFNAAEVRYLVVGGYAVAFHARPRFTKDLDVWVDPSPENARRTWEALRRFGAPLSGVTVQDLANPEMVYQIGIPPNRVDILMGVTGLAFPDAWEHRVAGTYGDCPLHVLGRHDLIRNKRATGRPQDLLDLQVLVSPPMDAKGAPPGG